MTFAERVRTHRLVIREIQQAATDHGCTLRIVGEREVEVSGEFLAVHRTRIEASQVLGTEISMEPVAGLLDTYNLKEV